MMMLKLIERIEALEGPDREVDALIWFECIGKADGWEYDGQQRKPYTASLDAAMTLVPEGWAWGIKTEHDSDRLFDIPVAATPALALCAAALRARLQDKE